jgi:MOSC domain-containing protein YiiM
MVKAFAEAGRWGVYFRVVREGVVGTGDPVERIHADPAGLRVYDIARVYIQDRDDRATMERLSAHARLDPSWRRHFAGKLDSRARGGAG